LSSKAAPTGILSSSGAKLAKAYLGSSKPRVEDFLHTMKKMSNT
jgi:hypothetical protein